VTDDEMRREVRAADITTRECASEAQEYRWIHAMRTEHNRRRCGLQPKPLHSPEPPGMRVPYVIIQVFPDAR
jgi:hypothetical protein